MGILKKPSAKYFLVISLALSFGGCLLSSSSNTNNTTVITSTGSISWEGLDPNDSWQGIASSTDGNKLVARKKNMAKFILLLILELSGLLID